MHTLEVFANNEEKMRRRVEWSSLESYPSFISSAQTDDIAELKKRRIEDFAIKRKSNIYLQEGTDNMPRAKFTPRLTSTEESTLSTDLGYSISHKSKILNRTEVNYLKEMLISHSFNSLQELRNLMDFIFNMATEPENRTLMIKSEFTLHISKIFKASPNEESELIEAIMPTLASLCDYNFIKFYQIKPAIHKICSYLKGKNITQSNVEVMLWILSLCTEKLDNKKTSNILFFKGMEPILFSFLINENSKIQLHSLRILGNICLRSSKKTERIVNAGLLPRLKPLLLHKDRTIRKDAVWVVSNLCVGSQYHIETLIEENFFPPLKDIMLKDVFSVKKEAIWAICNLSNNKNPYHAELLIEQGILETLFSLLSNKSNHLILMALEAFINFLELDTIFSQTEPNGNNKENLLNKWLIPMGFLEVLEKLQLHQDEKVYEKANFILEHYLMSNEEDGILIY